MLQVFEKEDLTVAEQYETFASVEEPNIKRELTEFERDNLLKEIEGVDFYVAQGFTDLAEKALTEIEGKFGQQIEIDDARKSLNANNTELAYNEVIQNETIKASIPEVEEPVAVEKNSFELASNFEHFEEVESAITQSSDNLLNDIKSEFGIAEENDDFDTPYQTGTASGSSARRPRSR